MGGKFLIKNHLSNAHNNWNYFIDLMQLAFLEYLNCTFMKPILNDITMIITQCRKPFILVIFFQHIYNMGEKSFTQRELFLRLVANWWCPTKMSDSDWKFFSTNYIKFAAEWDWNSKNSKNLRNLDFFGKNLGFLEKKHDFFQSR